MAVEFKQQWDRTPPREAGYYWLRDSSEHDRGVWLVAMEKKIQPDGVEWMTCVSTIHGREYGTGWGFSITPEYESCADCDLSEMSWIGPLIPPAMESDLTETEDCE